MPIYEYRCNNCRKRVAIFLKSFSQEPHPICDRCHSTDLERLFSRFAVVKSEDAHMEDLDSSLGGLDDAALEDPRAAAKWLRKMKGQIGEEAGPEFDEMVAQMEAGESPEGMNGEEETLTDDEG